MFTRLKRRIARSLPWEVDDISMKVGYLSALAEVLDYIGDAAKGHHADNNRDALVTCADIGAYVGRLREKAHHGLIEHPAQFDDNVLADLEYHKGERCSYGGS